MDLGDFPSTLSFTASGPAPTWAGRLYDGHRDLPLSEITAVYYRRPTSFRFPAHLSSQQRWFAATEARQGLGGLLESLRVPFVNRPSSIADAALKPAQLQVAAEVGFQIPPTLITSIGAEARAFVRQVGKVIYKPLTAPFGLGAILCGLAGRLPVPDVRASSDTPTHRRRCRRGRFPRRGFHSARASRYPPRRPVRPPPSLGHTRGYFPPLARPRPADAQPIRRRRQRQHPIRLARRR